MKKKISVFTLLLFLFLCFSCSLNIFAQTDSTAAFEDWCDVNNLSSVIDSTLTDDELNRSIHYIVFYEPDNNNCYYVFRFTTSNDFCKPYFSGNKFYINDPSSSYSFCWTRINNTEWGECFVTHNFQSYPEVYHNTYPFHDKQIVFSTLDIYTDSSCTDILFKRSESIFNFYFWCSDAGLECKSSKYESQSVIPYSYNDYWHIVRKSYDGKWLLTTIGNSVMQDNISDYTLMLTENGNLAVLNLYSGEDSNGYKLNVRQYLYDTDGWKLLSYETFDSRDDDDCIIDFGAGSGFDQSRLLAYTCVDIHDEGFNVVYPTSTEYYEVTASPPTEEPDSPTPIPTTVPDNDSSGGGRPGSGSRPDTGGQATGGGGLDFIINLFTLIWIKICSIPMAVDGYSISLQQIIVYGALVSIVGGFIMHFIFGRK